MSLKQSSSVLSLFYFRIPRMSRPILTSFMRSRTTKPPPQKKMSPTPARTTFSIFIFWAGSVRRDKREMLSISPKQIPPPMLPRSAYRGIEREDPGPEQVGLGYRAVSAVGGDRGRARTVHSGGMRKSYIVGNFNSSIFEICLSRSITICSSNGPL